MSGRQFAIFVLGLLIVTSASRPTLAANAAQGKRLALTYCARCHAVDKVSPSPLKIAPPFRTLHERYPVGMLEESLAEGIVTGHPTMPQFRFERDQIGDFIAFLKTLE
ncbi:MAG TPA: c-type cytochrome [Bradyrhizobium sp.]|uniref:c-type cytochrome n=1 Tax=Bradyrhizobium sp. TaxID=376 RepID=UPI002D8000D9|nr:c-type cytochrome [Bradyrhizobium sp.]HET7884816.1 c-type cytochrome [Bradyrhizobium sp.]